MHTHDYLAVRVRQPGAAHVATPAKHEGVGNALRTAYFPGIKDLPADLQRLLDQIP